MTGSRRGGRGRALLLPIREWTDGLLLLSLLSSCTEILGATKVELCRDLNNSMFLETNLVMEYLN